MNWSELLFACRSHALFLRLQYIGQLGSLPFMRDDALNYSRWDHSMGVGAIAALVTKRHGVRGTMLGVAFELGASFHDIGHGAYSHCFDHYLDKLKLPEALYPRHERRSAHILALVVRETVARGLWCLEVHKYVEDFIATACNFITPTEYSRRAANNPFVNLLNAPTTRHLDIDRLEYIPRDAHLLKSRTHTQAIVSVYLDELVFEEEKYCFRGPLSTYLLDTREALVTQVYSRPKAYDWIMHSFFYSLRLHEACNVLDEYSRSMFAFAVDSNTGLEQWVRQRIAPLCLAQLIKKTQETTHVQEILKK